MTAPAPWRDPRFHSVDHRRSFEQTCLRGVVHTTMQAAGHAPGDKPTVMVTPREYARAAEPPSTLKLLTASHTSDPRFPEGSGLGPRQNPGGLEWRRRRTQELDHSRGCTAGAFNVAIPEMRSAGISTKKRGEMCMMGWH
ncbi:unnamed protein product, partial [Polarella glacialis]